MRYRASFVLVGMAVVGASVSPMAAQVSEIASRGPRFIYASAERPGKGTVVAAADAREAAVLRQRLSIALRDASLADALREVVREGHLQLIYSRAVLPADRRVSLEAKRITVAAALTEILLDTGLDVVLTRSGQMTLARRRTKVSVVTDSGAIVGRVTDAKTGAGIGGVEMLLAGTRWRSTTDTAGRYRLGGVEVGSYTLTTRRLGYAKQSRPVTVAEGRTDTVDVALEPTAARLDELVTTATGVQRRRDLGNAITTIQADSVMQTAPIRNLTDLLANRVPGLTVQHTSGAPGDPARLRLRGLGSALRSNDPVVVVDGIRVYAAQSGARSGNLTNLSDVGKSTLDPDDPGRTIQFSRPPAPSPLDQIDPNTIEKIEVFKGPSAATLYGADAANGVIVITTKKGRPGPARWNATLAHARKSTLGRYPTGYYRWGHSINDNTPVFCTLVTTVRNTDNNNTPVPCVADSLVQYQALNDPRLTVLGQGRRSDGSLTVSGGSQALTYSLTGTYTDETGLLRLPDLEVDRFRTLMGREAPDWMRRPHQYTTWSATSNVRALLGPTADVTLLMMLARDEQQRTSLEDQVSVLAGTYVDRVNGLYYRPFRPGNASEALRNTANFLQNYYRRTTASALTVKTGLSAGWHPRPWFTTSANAGLDLTPRLDEQFLPVGLPGFGSDSGVLIRGTGRSLQSNFNLQGTASRGLGRGFRFETSAGVNLTTQRTDDVIASASRLVPGTSSLSGARDFRVTDNLTNASVFGWYVEPRLTGQRLSLSTGIRLDGGSAYGARLTRSGGGLFGLLALPKLNGSWVISEEPWFPFTALFSSLRLRGAYGQAQVQPGATDRLRLYQRSAGDGHFQLNTLGNTALRPERSVELEGGFDADLLDNRLSLELTLYRKVQHDALLPLTLPSSVNGGGSVMTNIGTIRNRGLEVMTRLTPLRGPTTWTLELSHSRNSNLLAELGPGVTPNRETGLVAGYPVGGRWARPIVGFADQNGDGVLQSGEIKVGDSAVYLGWVQPTAQTALHTSLALWGGALSVAGSFSYTGGATQQDGTAGANWVLARALVDPSTPLNEQAAILAATTYLTNIPTSYGVTAEVSTLRFQSLSVRYRAPAALARFVRAEELSVAVQGDNLGLHSTYKGKDPDVMAWDAGEGVVDLGQLAQPRTWQLTVNVRY